MSLEFDWTTILLTITVIQGLYLGSILTSSRTWTHPSCLLGLTLIIFSSGLIYDVIQRIGLLKYYPMLYFIPVKFYYLQAPLAYLSARAITPKPLQWKDFLWLVPAIAEFILLVILFFLPVEIKSVLETPQSEWHYSLFLYRSLWIPFSIVVLFKCYQVIRQNRDRFNILLSAHQDETMQWAMKASIFTAVFCFIFATKFFVDPATHSMYAAPINAVLILSFVTIIGTKGIKLSWIDYDYDTTTETTTIQESDKEKAERKEVTGYIFIENLKIYIEKHKPYRDPDLTLDSLSKDTLISARQISSSVNRFTGMNFNTFINEFRVAEAKLMLRDEQYNHLNTLGIGYEVGFNSKATFYSVFKKQTGMTPAQWQKQVN